MTPEDYKCLGKIVVARTTQGDVYTVGKAISYTTEPTLAIRTRTGEVVHWIAQLCEVLDLEPALIAILWHEEEP